MRITFIKKVYPFNVGDEIDLSEVVAREYIDKGYAKQSKQYTIAN